MMNFLCGLGEKRDLFGDLDIVAEFSPAGQVSIGVGQGLVELLRPSDLGLEPPTLDLPRCDPTTSQAYEQRCHD
jgi:hypothetical protein